MFSIFYLFVDITHSDEKWETWKILRSYDQFQIHSGRDTRGDQLCHFRSLLIHEYWRLSKINFLYGSPVKMSKNFRACEAADGRGISHRRRPPPALKCVCQPGRQARRQAQGDSGGGLCVGVKQNVAPPTSLLQKDTNYSLLHGVTNSHK